MRSDTRDQDDRRPHTMKTDLLDIRNMDCMELMREYSDNHFDLAIVDPPYGINVGNDARNGLMMKKAATKRKDYAKKDWDKVVPNENYFKELFRVSKQQIIWGVNYYPYNFLSGGRIYWDKDTAEEYTNSDGELAFYSKSNSLKSFKCRWNGMLQYDMKNKEERIHPTQKPIRLYEWLLSNYAKEGDKILDTHMGSGSIAIACHYAGHHLTACELDKDYFDAACERINNETRQKTLF